MSGQALQIAGQQIGLDEQDQRAALTEYLRNGGQNLDPATTAWCAAFVNASLSHAGGQGTDKLNARSYLDWGQPVDQPREGDIAVFSRGDPNGWQGHVGFFKGYDDQGNILVLGGNQGDKVSVAPYSANRLLGFRRGGGVPEQANTLSQSAERPPQMNHLASTLDPRAFTTPTNALQLSRFD